MVSYSPGLEPSTDVWYVNFSLYIKCNNVKYIKFHRPWRLRRGLTYSSNFSATSALDWTGFSTSHPSCFTAENSSVPLTRQALCTPGSVWTVRKISSSHVFDLPTVEDVVISHTGYTIPAQKCNTVSAETLRCQHFTFFLYLQSFCSLLWPSQSIYRSANRTNFGKFLYGQKIFELWRENMLHELANKTSNLQTLFSNPLAGYITSI